MRIDTAVIIKAMGFQMVAVRTGARARVGRDEILVSLMHDDVARFG